MRVLTGRGWGVVAVCAMRANISIVIDVTRVDDTKQHISLIYYKYRRYMGVSEV